jgi:hypothetical protein
LNIRGSKPLEMLKETEAKGDFKRLLNGVGDDVEVVAKMAPQPPPPNFVHVEPEREQSTSPSTKGLECD